MSLNLSHPCPTGTPTDGFGWRKAIPGVVRAQLHAGQDYAAPKGAPVLAAHSGRVNKVWWDEFSNGDPAGGNMLQIGAANCSTRYAHLNAYAVRLGDEVRAGQVIGYVGRTGAANGDHLHFELLLPGGQYVNPVPYLTATPTTKKEAKKMAVLIRNHDGSIGLVNDSGELFPISNLDEVRALQASGLVGQWTQMQDGLVWNLLQARTERIQKQRDEAAVNK